MKKAIKDKKVNNRKAARPGKGKRSTRSKLSPGSVMTEIAGLLAAGEADAQAGRCAHDSLLRMLEGLLAVGAADDTYDAIVANAVEIAGGECGLIMLRGETGDFEAHSAYNLDLPETIQSQPDIWDSLASQVLTEGASVYVSDMVSSKRYAGMPSVTNLGLRSILSVPIKEGSQILGAVCVGNPMWIRGEIKSRLALLEFFADIASRLLHRTHPRSAVDDKQQLWKAIVDESPAGMVVVDTQGHLITMNPAALEVFDLNKDRVQITGQGEKHLLFTDLLPESERARWLYMINSAFTCGQGYTNDRYYHYTGYVEKVLSVKFSPLSPARADTGGLIIVLEDVTDKVQTEKYLVLSEKLATRGELASSVAHQLNNYLAVASNNAELLKLNIEREKYDAVAASCTTIVENIFKMKSVVEGLVDQSRPQPEYISYDIKRLVEDVLFSLRGQPEFKHTHFTIDLAQDIPNLEMDVEQVQQVLTHMLNNAADAIEEKAVEYQLEGHKFQGKITIRASYDTFGDCIVVEISDNGKGMTRETRGKIFDMHFSTKKGGHGLGLYNCRKIITQHGGELVVESDYDEGTEFKIILPRFRNQPDQ